SVGILLPDVGFPYDTTFYAVAGDPGCESNPVPMVVHVAPRPAAPLVTGGSVCGPGSITLSASSFFPVSWYDSSGNLIAVGPTVSANVNNTTVFSASVNDGTCNSLPSQAAATVLQQPTPSISGPDTLIITPGQITVLSTVTNGGTTPYAYAWSPGGQTTSSINVTQPGSYSVVVTDANGCTGADLTVVTILTALPGDAIEDEVKVYPNPVHGKLYLQTKDTAPERISLLDITARTINVSANETYEKGVMVIDLQDVPAGVYSLVWESKRGVVLRTIVVD
ncbi:MAG: T9SS type A sorting domain-containing protein, partial [Bacteroidota bacterium]